MSTDKIRDLQLRAAEILATGREGMEQITSTAEYPPCFESAADFHQWLRHNVTSPTPMRPDFPAEPNYCRDCMPEYQDRMKEEGRCLFPMVRFQEVADVCGDNETVGYTPKRFLPQTKARSYGYGIIYVGQGLYRTTWNVLANGSQQTKIVDRVAAEKFAERWGLDFNPRGSS